MDKIKEFHEWIEKSLIKAMKEYIKGSYENPAESQEYLIGYWDGLVKTKSNFERIYGPYHKRHDLIPEEELIKFHTDVYQEGNE